MKRVPHTIKILALITWETVQSCVLAEVGVEPGFNGDAVGEFVARNVTLKMT